MSTLKVDTILKRSGTGTITLGQSGDTLSIPSGATIANSGTATGFGENNTPSFFVRNSGNQDISHGSENTLTLDTEILDTDNAFASNKFTPQTAGKYFIAAQFTGSDDTYTSGNLAYIVLKIRKNGSGYESRAVINFNNNPARQGSLSVQAVVDLNGSSDYVDFSAEVGTNDSSTARIIGDYARASGFKIIGA